MDPITTRPGRRSGRATTTAVLLVGLLVATLAATTPPPVVGGFLPLAPEALTQAPGLRAELAADAPAGPGGPGRVHPTAVAAIEAAAARIGATGGDAGAHHAGKNHVWSSGLGLNRPVAWFPCSRSQPPGMAVYRWGCAGRNNVYLFAHAGGPFRRLHDLYVRGGLRRGMTVTYADGNGVVHRYRVAWWRVVLPTAGEFAFAAQSRPSMTLQTCVGAHDRYRLIVRLYQAD